MPHKQKVIPTGTIQSIEEFFDVIKENKDHVTFKAEFTVADVVRYLASQGWYQVDESKMPIHVRTKHDHVNLPGTYFFHKNKERKSMGKYQGPSKFIALNHDEDELWFASSRSATMHFEDYLHYHKMTFVQKQVLEDSHLLALPLVIL